MSAMECERMKTCPFFGDRMKHLPAVSHVIKQNYCLGDKNLCARYQVAAAGIAIPDDLFPSDKARAQRLLQQN
jgi:hypothetical protein